MITSKSLVAIVSVTAVMAAAVEGLAAGPAGGSGSNHWEWCGWGGGGYFWCAVFHPTQAGTIYMGSDENGVYKTDDLGRHWRMINNGLANYGVFSLAVDRTHPQTVYAATWDGLCKSTDGGEHWQLLPKTGPQDLRIIGAKPGSVRSIAVAPSDGNVVFAGTPEGKIYKSPDGGQTWQQVYQVPLPAGEPAAPPHVLRAQFGGVNGEFFGGFVFSATVSPSDAPKDFQGIGFTFKGNGVAPKNASLQIKTSDGAMYNSKNLGARFAETDEQDVWLTGDDFTLDSGEARKQPEKAKSWSQQPVWRKLAQVLFVTVNMNNEKPSSALFGSFYLAPVNVADQAARVVIRNFARDKTCTAYGNARTGHPLPPKAGTIFSVALATKNPAMVLGATEQAGIVMSADGGKTWQMLPTPKKAMNVVVAEADPNLLFGAFGKDGVWKSTDQGRTWANCSKGLDAGSAIREVVVSPANAQDVFAIGERDIQYDGQFYASHDGGGTWNKAGQFACDPEANPTMAQGLSRTTNLAVSPANPNELFISANWRAWHSDNGGQTWSERDRGADISCIQDVRFQGARVYASAMDEGAFVSEDDGTSWRQLWPLKFDPALSGHYWRLAVFPGDNGKDRILSTCSPWNGSLPNRVVISEDGGATLKQGTTGLPDYRPTANTMWGMSYPRALAVDPTNPRTIYLGMDGNATDGKSGGGIFKSEDGGYTWKQLAHQPGSRRAFYGLAIDPTDVRRLYWGACATGGGVWRSEDCGDSWQHVFTNGDWVFNVMSTTNGDVYCGEVNLWRSMDHGNTWKQLTHFTGPGSIVGLEADPRDLKTLWISRVTWGEGAGGGVYKTTDGGVTWQEITGDLPYRKPLVLRFNPATCELWAAGAGLFRIKQD